ncbi:MAG: hypothetical protein R3E89_16140 [Thiolinea sp.]
MDPGPVAAVFVLAVTAAFRGSIPEPPPERLRILDHIRASGLFLWKHQRQGREQLVHALQQQLQHTLQQRIPGLAVMPSERQQQAIATYLEWPEARMAQLRRLLSATVLDEQDFTQLTQLAHSLRKPT